MKYIIGGAVFGWFMALAFTMGLQLGLEDGRQEGFREGYWHARQYYDPEAAEQYGKDLDLAYNAQQAGATNG
jgi:hypothetical protein